MSTNPDWFTTGYPHIWLPYAQMQTVAAPLPVVSASGSILTLADGRTLVDGIASWWSMCHGYQHPHIVEAITRQAQTLSHVMFAGLAHEPAYTLAARLCATVGMGMERDVFLGIRLGRRRSGAKDGLAILAEQRRTKTFEIYLFQQRLPWRHTRRDERLCPQPFQRGL